MATTPKTKREVGEEIVETLADRRKKDSRYMKSLRPQFLAKLKAEPLETVLCSKAYEPAFGKTYTAFCNTVPITVQFNGTEQKFPKSIARWLRRKIEKTIEANAPKVQNDEFTK